MPGTRWPKDPVIFADSPKLPPGFALRSYPAISAAWKFSAGRLNKAAASFRAEFTDDWFALAVAGSFGRLDAGPKSDADFLVLIDGATSDSEVKARVDRARQIFAEQGFEMPNPRGSFSAPVNLATLTDTIGAAQDGLIDLARRMVLLMEMQCLYNEPLVERALQKLLGTYLRYQKKEPEKHPLFLLNEVIRFFRSICVNYELSFWDENEKWAIRNAKLRHSRVLMYFGMLALILNSSVKEDKLGYLLAKMGLTPLERLCHVYMDCGERDASRALGPYNVFVHHINDVEFRKRLQRAEYNNRYDFPEYALLKANSDALGAELTRFVLDRRGQWPQKILGYLIF